MNSKERILNCLEFRPFDRIGRFDQFWNESRECFIKHFGLSEDTDLEEYFDVDIVKLVANEEPMPLKAHIKSENGGNVIRRNGWGMIEKVGKGSCFTEEIEPPIKQYCDIDRLEFDSPLLDFRYENAVRIAGKKRNRAIFGKIGGPFIRTEHMRGKTQYLMDIAEDPQFVREMAYKVNEHLLAVGKELLRRANLYDTGIWIFDDMAYNHGPLLSPRSFEEIFLPLYRRLVGRRSNNRK